MAAFGAALAIPTGMLLFAVQARDYVGLWLFGLKLALVAVGLAHVLIWGRALAGATPVRQRAAGVLSLAIWVSALVCGRMIGYL
jgi:hypothetical protein